VGAAIGPTVAGSAMEIFGPRMLFAYFALVLALVAVFTFYRTRKEPEAADAPRGQFVPMIRTSAVALDMMSGTERGNEGSAAEPQ